MKLKYLSKRNLRKIQDWSSGFLINSKEFYLMKKQDFECEDCGKDLIKDYDYPSFTNGEVLCEDCNIEKNYTRCEICDSDFPNIDFPDEEEHIYIGMELSKETGYKMGIYKVLSKPFFYGSILTGFDAFFDNSLELIKSINISMYYEIKYGNSEDRSGIICPNCVEKFTEKGYIKPLRYWNSKKNKFEIQIHKTINIRELIKNEKF